jgi:caa(3)-type oxidase subunit IV
MSGEHTKHVTGRQYALTYAALIVLATLSLVLEVTPIQTGIGVALVIAFVKAILVLGWFMHLVEESFGFKVVMLVSTALVVTLICLTVLDPLTRTYPPPPTANHEYKVSVR